MPVNGKLTLDEMKERIAKGQTLIHEGKVISRITDLPSAVDLALGDPNSVEHALSDVEAEQKALDDKRAKLEAALAKREKVEAPKKVEEKAEPAPEKK